jgi:hypothetical protein
MQSTNIFYLMLSVKYGAHMIEAHRQHVRTGSLTDLKHARTRLLSRSTSKLTSCESPLLFEIGPNPIFATVVLKSIDFNYFTNIKRLKR